MTLAESLFTRLLAMDAYFRGAGATALLPPNNSGIGLTIFEGDEAYLPAGSVAEGFYAAAYTIDGATVISYRGTDTGGEFVATDFPISAGAWEDESTLLAMQFYNSVAAATDNPILLTGHSLGGGLAGFVASLTNRPAMRVDHTGFMTARARRRRGRAAFRPRPATTLRARSV